MQRFAEFGVSVGVLAEVAEIAAPAAEAVIVGELVERADVVRCRASVVEREIARVGRVNHTAIQQPFFEEHGRHRVDVLAGGATRKPQAHERVRPQEWNDAFAHRTEIFRRAEEPV